MDINNIFSLLGEKVETIAYGNSFEEQCKKLCEYYISTWDTSSRKEMIEQITCYRAMGHSKLVDAEINKGLRRLVDCFNKVDPNTSKSGLLETHLINLLKEVRYSNHPERNIERWKIDRGDYQRADPKPSLTR